MLEHGARLELGTRHSERLPDLTPAGGRMLGLACVVSCGAAMPGELTRRNWQALRLGGGYGCPFQP